ncbi:MAG TPA: DNA polymerase I, partial [Coxiellaceae bacterium]|nr:DNA polymerase I [Coxiellaceae bacterium]
MTSNKKKLLVLIDGSSYLHRAFHALPPLTTSKGEPTGAIYGVINMIRKTLSDHKPDYIAVVFDAKGKNFRHEMYPEYKANRPPMEEDLKIQVKPLHEIIRAMGLPLLILDGVEADDVIGTIAREAAKKETATLISTGDKDMAQLVEPDITLVNTMSNTTMDEAGVKTKFGVEPKQIVDYLTLVGDTSDNISGVSGVGPKTAVKWLEEYGTLINIIEHKDMIKGKVGDNLRASLDR